MNRKQLEHVLRACGSIAGCREIVVIGSQALLASCPDAPDALLRSMEVDCYPLDDPAKADLIDGSIGELSPFHETFGIRDVASFIALICPLLRFVRGDGHATMQNRLNR